MNAYIDGFRCGLGNDRECPWPWWTPLGMLWLLGNDAGLRIHCAIVERLYLESLED